MDLYFSPLACSMATRIALYEAGAAADFKQVDGRTKRLADGSDYRVVNPMGQVPALRTDDGELLTENPVVLQYVADRYPESGLAPRDGIARYRLQSWLNFTTSELHKLVFNLLLDSKSPDAAKEYARTKIDQRFGHLNAHLTGREFLLDRFTVADAYLVTVLNWSKFTGIELAKFPAVQAYVERLQARPSVAMKGSGKGWVTGEYGMLPRSTESRTPRESSRGKQSGRTLEIQRLIGRTLRAVMDLKALGERTVWLDCDVIQADGGTRTASITGAYVALALSLERMVTAGILRKLPLLDYLAAISVGLVEDELLLDLAYEEDSAAQVDMNVVMTGSGHFVEVQASAEGRPYTDVELQDLMKLAAGGIRQLIRVQTELLHLKFLPRSK